MVSLLPAPPKITVGMMDGRLKIAGRLHGPFRGDGCGLLAGGFSANAVMGEVVLLDEGGREICRSSRIKLTAEKNSLFSLFKVPIGNRFHWERMEDQTFKGELLLQARENGTICAINQIDLEDYLTSVIASEMNPEAPIEFLKVHAIISRSWFLSGWDRKKKSKDEAPSIEKRIEGEILRCYDRAEHDLFDVCADDHCQRYQGIQKIASSQAEEAVQQTYGRVMVFQDAICDARYSKACGGRTETFATAWEDRAIPYLTSVSDATLHHPPILSEKDAEAWILSTPSAYCNPENTLLLERILPGIDCQTKDYFRWRVEYSRKELEEILREKSGMDLGRLKEMVPLRRGPSGRISRLEIVGSKKRVIVGKELEIRRWLSPTHLYSSAFFVKSDADRFIFHGAGWGHGVGLCQIGAAVMASQGWSAEEILRHYFPGVEIKKIY